MQYSENVDGFKILTTNFVSSLKPTILILNSAFWALPEEYNYDRLAKSAKFAVKNTVHCKNNKLCDGRVIWKTQTTQRNPVFPRETQDYIKTFQKYGIEIFDVKKHTEVLPKHPGQIDENRLFWDVLHYYPAVYRGLNNILLTILLDRDEKSFTNK